jgi:hypothetical protein
VCNIVVNAASDAMKCHVSVAEQWGTNWERPSQVVTLVTHLK